MKSLFHCKKQRLFSTLLFFIPLITSGLTIGACSDSEVNMTPVIPPDPSGTGGVIEVVTEKVIINPSVTYQTMEGFSASDCWNVHWIGKYWTQSRDAICDLLFSQDIVDGQPKGIGLSMWRFNLGGGSMEQGDKSGIVSPTGRAECFLDDNGEYDWNKCEGQRYFMNRAKELGVEKFVLFSNSPLVRWTHNGQARSDQGASSNLKDEHYQDFADYMAQVASHFTKQGYNVSHISPANEPQFNWDGDGQEGSGWTNTQLAKLARCMNTSLSRHAPQTNILLGESGSYQSLIKLENPDDKSDVIKCFFTPGSESYIGDLAHVDNQVCGHSLWTDSSWDYMRDVRRLLKEKAKEYGIRVWQTEWSLLGDNYVVGEGEYVGHGDATELDIALYMSKVIHNDLTQANIPCWSYWTALGVPRFGHKDRFLLVSLMPASGVDWGDLADGDGTFYGAPTLWVLGNYSRFIRPGFKRISVSHNETRYFFGSAYIAPDNKRIVAVFNNLSDKVVNLNEVHVDWPAIQNITTYTTSSTESLKGKDASNDESILLQPNSVTTIVYDLK